MILAVFGATGPTGLQLVRQALEAGHSVRALVRNPSRMTITNNSLRVVMGDVLDLEACRKTLLGSEGALSCLGSRNLFKNVKVVSRGTQNIMSTMVQMGLRRLVVESAYGASESYDLAGAGMKLVVRTILAAPYADKNIIEPEIKASSLDWTIVRPVALTNGPRTGKYRVGDDLRLGAGARISRADVAEFMLREFSERKWVGKAPSIAY
ncbi:MAG TPA: SDR family oxidoreductase [candidate division Zixibacteria bacterium]|nr:SDR family oxidoreductase [candidate division Zixibacteria bacterium]